jgi:hypothetical protein
MSDYYKFEFYVPSTHVETVKKAVFAAGAGVLGNYDCCSWETEGVGQFRPREGSEPYLGERGRVEKVKEFKVEMVCAKDSFEEVLRVFKDTHPYETPAYQYWEINIL